MRATLSNYLKYWSRSIGKEVAVGTAVTCRPRTDPYARNYRIRLLPRVMLSARSVRQIPTTEGI